MNNMYRCGFKNVDPMDSAVQRIKYIILKSKISCFELEALLLHNARSTLGVHSPA